MDQENSDSLVPTPEKPKKSRIKKWLKIILVLIVIGGGLYVYFWYTNIQGLQEEANQALEASQSSQAEIISLRNYKEQVDLEFTRCQTFISEEEGSFGEFEYCQSFLDWAKKTVKIDD